MFSLLNTFCPCQQNLEIIDFSTISAEVRAFAAVPSTAVKTPKIIKLLPKVFCPQQLSIHEQKSLETPMA